MRHRAVGLVVAAVAAALGMFVASPARAALPTVDLKPTFGTASFNGSMLIFRLQVSNAGPGEATAATVTIELVDGGASPALTFTAQRTVRGRTCTLLSPAKIACRLDDPVAGAGSRGMTLALPTDERTHVPGGATPTPMPIKAKVTVAAAETDSNPADNTATGQVLRTVTATPKDWVARAQPVTGKVGEVVYVTVTSFFKGPTGDSYPAGQKLSRLRAPAGTEWAEEPPLNCLEVRPKVERRCVSEEDFPGTPGEPGADSSFTYGLRILSREVGEGTFRVEALGGDPDLSNNCARIIVTVEGAPARTVPDGCAEPAPARPASPTARATGGLPVTGTHTLAFAGAGAGLLAAGTVALLVLRRRRRTFAA
ncbi:LPXTG cell wall anchor domain-containing protein [Longispora sp. NPDC051575]|uniref:LPXTG cell wall anchor domain-containing protein n=1 Tax=Longispora sp. NPDC051575 TaxID=3154943 RepID=UPI00344591C1